jgi:hypothetical protein
MGRRLYLSGWTLPGWRGTGRKGFGSACLVLEETTFVYRSGYSPLN